jgi:WD40 repeat protein
LAVLADGRRALSGSHDKTLRLWDLATGETARHWSHSETTAVAVSGDGRRALFGSAFFGSSVWMSVSTWRYSLELWDVTSGEIPRAVKGHTHPHRVTAVAVPTDGRFAIFGSDDKTLRLWDLASGAILRTLEGHTDRVTAVAVMADGCRALSGSDDHTLRLWDLASGGCLAQFPADAAITCVAFARNDLIVAGSADGRLHILEIRQPGR